MTSKNAKAKAEGLSSEAKKRLAELAENRRVEIEMAETEMIREIARKSPGKIYAEYMQRPTVVNQALVAERRTLGFPDWAGRILEISVESSIMGESLLFTLVCATERGPGKVGLRIGEPGLLFEALRLEVGIYGELNRNLTSFIQRALDGMYGTETRYYAQRFTIMENSRNQPLSRYEVSAEVTWREIMQWSSSDYVYIANAINGKTSPPTDPPPAKPKPEPAPPIDLSERHDAPAKAAPSPFTFVDLE